MTCRAEAPSFPTSHTSKHNENAASKTSVHQVESRSPHRALPVLRLSRRSTRRLLALQRSPLQLYVCPSVGVCVRTFVGMFTTCPRRHTINSQAGRFVEKVFQDTTLTPCGPIFKDQALHSKQECPATWTR